MNTAEKKPHPGRHVQVCNAFRALCLVLCAGVLFADAGCAGRSAWSEPDTCVLTVINGQGKTFRVTAEKADNDYRRMKGLMYRTSLETDRGMLFIFDREQVLSFWMRNTYIPLSIAYIDAAGIIRDIYEMRPLDDSVTYPSRSRVKYALEMNRRWFSDRGVTPGSRIVLDGCLRK